MFCGYNVMTSCPGPDISSPGHISASLFKMCECMRDDDDDDDDDDENDPLAMIPSINTIYPLPPLTSIIASSVSGSCETSVKPRSDRPKLHAYTHMPTYTHTPIHTYKLKLCFNNYEHI